MSPRQAAAVAEARKVIELSARHQIGLEFTADGWRMTPLDLDRVLTFAPMADELVAL